MSGLLAGIRQPWSMAAKLVGLQVLAAVLLNTGAFLFLVKSISRDLNADNRDDLENQVRLFREWFEDPNTRAAAIMERFSPPADDRLPVPPYSVRILDRRGRPLYEVKDSRIPPVSAFPRADGTVVAWHAPDGQHYLVTAVQIILGEGNRKAVLQVAFDVSDDFVLIRRIMLYTSIVFGLMLLSSAGLAFWIARRTLRPLTSLADSAARVQASRLDLRLGKIIWPRELMPVVKEYDAMLGRLESSFRRLVVFSTDLSHDLRTPINNLRGDAEVALSRPRTVEEYRAVLQSSLEEYARITRLIDTILFIARADQPERSLARQRLDAAAECRVVANYFEAATAERGVALLVRGAAEIYCDPVLFRRALGNLIDNALRHTPAAGRIDLTVRAGLAGGCEVEVSDTGAGIAAEHMPHLFERFYRAGTTEDKARVGSFGLGLAIVKSIMELHAGRVEIESTLGQGTAITLHFPG